MSFTNASANSIHALSGQFILGAGLNLQPETWPQPVQLILVCLAAGLGAFIAGRFLLTGAKAFFVAVVAAVFAGAAAYLVFHPNLHEVPGVDRAVQSLKPEHAPARTTPPPVSPHPAAPQATGTAAKAPTTAKKIVLRADWDEAKKHFLLDGESVPPNELEARLKKAKEQHKEPGAVSVLLAERLCHSQQHRKEVEKVCDDLKIPFKEESAAKPKQSN
jgi:hypothetical protein